MTQHGFHQEASEAPKLRPAVVPRTRRALLAEDDDEMRRLVATALRRAGYAVVEVADGVALLTEIGSTFWSLESSGFDLVVSESTCRD